MSSRSFKCLRREGATSMYCCVPLCDTSSRFNLVVCFHTFPLDKETSKKWIHYIRREDFNITTNTRVCSRAIDSHRTPATEERWSFPELLPVTSCAVVHVCYVQISTQMGQSCNHLVAEVVVVGHLDG